MTLTRAVLSSPQPPITERTTTCTLGLSVRLEISRILMIGEHGREHPISRHFRFDSAELGAYRQLHTDQSLGWMDSEFMFQLSLDQILREVAALAPDHPELLSTIELVDSSQLLRHYINNDIRLLDDLLALCGEHYLLHRQLQHIKAFPTLHSD